MNKVYKGIISICGGSSISSQEYSIAEHLGKSLALKNYKILNGGYGGAMEAVSKGVHSVNGCCEGVVVPSFYNDKENEYLSGRIVVDSLFDQINELISQSDKIIVLPGSLGTFNELISALTTDYINSFNNRPIKPIYAFSVPYKSIWNCICEELHLSDTIRHYVTFYDTVDELLEQF